MLCNIDELTDHGRGLKLIWQIADEFTCTRTATAQNCLLISKNYEQPTNSAPSENQKPKLFQQLLDQVPYLDWLKSQGDSQPTTRTILKKINLQVKTDLNALNEVLLWFDQLEPPLIPQNVLFQCKLALAEGFTNAVRHAHKGMPEETPIELQVTVFHHRLEIKIWDAGPPFDLEAKLRKFREEAQAKRNVSLSKQNKNQPEFDFFTQ